MSEVNLAKQEKSIEEKEINAMSGWLGLFLGILFILAFPAGIVLSVVFGMIWPIFVVIVLLIVGILLLCGLKIVNPNESIVFVLFGNYYGTL
ncbi:MAG: SPFH domain-containing protein, partial [Intestinibacter sp.]|nr:SPFH domain-containing protein [Intestinibacter sp.]